MSVTQTKFAVGQSVKVNYLPGIVGEVLAVDVSRSKTHPDAEATYCIHWLSDGREAKEYTRESCLSEA